MSYDHFVNSHVMRQFAAWNDVKELDVEGFTSEVTFVGNIYKKIARQQRGRKFQLWLTLTTVARRARRVT